MKKYCSHCDKTLPVSDFYKNRARYDNLESVCKNCKKIVAHESYERNRSRRLAKTREYYQEHKKEKGAAVKLWREVNREQYNERMRNYYSQQSERPKVLARRAVHLAIKSGKLLKPKGCSVVGCNRQDIHAHHAKDYLQENWLDIRWLCPEHHKQVHSKTI